MRIIDWLRRRNGGIAVAIAILLMLGGPAFALTEQQAVTILKRPPFPPTDIDLLWQDLYPAGEPLVPAAQYPFDEESVRASLRQRLVMRFPDQPEQVLKGMRAFNNSAINFYVPDPRLRAALAVLTGTLSEGAIDTIRNGKFASVGFGILSNEGWAAEARCSNFACDRVDIIVAERYQYEDMRLLASLLTHEHLHHDAAKANSNREELILLAIQTLVHASFVLEAPQLARSGTELGRSQNTNLMALVNSRDASGRIRLLTGRGPIFPGSTTAVQYFAQPSIARGLGPSTPGSPASRRALSAITGMALTSAPFNDATLNTFDQNINLFTPQQWVQLARALKLDLNPPSLALVPAAPTPLSRQTAAEQGVWTDGPFPW